MDKQTLAQIYGMLNEIEVKGMENVNRLFSVLYVIRGALEEQPQAQVQPQEQEQKKEIV